MEKLQPWSLWETPAEGGAGPLFRGSGDAAVLGSSLLLSTQPVSALLSVPAFGELANSSLLLLDQTPPKKPPVSFSFLQTPQ